MKRLTSLLLCAALGACASPKAKQDAACCQETSAAAVSAASCCSDEELEEVIEAEVIEISQLSSAPEVRYYVISEA